MSTVRRAASAYNAHLTLIAALQPEHAIQFRALTEGLTSTALADILTDLDVDSMETIDDAQHLWNIVERTLPWEQAFSQATLTEFSYAQSLVESLHELDGDAAQPNLAEFHTGLVQAVETARVEIAAVEQCATAQAIDLALEDLGYHVARADLEGVVTGFEASKADCKLVVEVTAGGQVVTDFVGLSDAESCGSAQGALVEKVGTYGVDLAEQDRHDHHDTRGGGLVQRVARASGGTFADRIVSAHGVATATRNLAQLGRSSHAVRKATA